MKFARTLTKAALAFVPGPAFACELALILAVDISGSVDTDEYEIQMRGLAQGLRDGVVAEALVQGQSQVMLVQWTGSSRQVVSVPWTKIDGFPALEALAGQIDATPRVWRNFSTAIGEAVKFSKDQFAQTESCARRVIDVSGDGINNEGVEPVSLHSDLRDADVTVNALVIEGAGDDLTGYFWENVISGEGAFVVTANDFDDYPEKMRQKLTRETARQISSLPVPIRPNTAAWNPNPPDIESQNLKPQR